MMSEIVKTENETVKKKPYEAIDDFAEMLEPLAVILEDKEFSKLAKGNNMVRFVIQAIKKYRKEVLEFLSLYTDTPVEELELTKQTLLPTLCDIISDQHIKKVFFS